ncbi:MAG: TIGR00730 family Rossman fold protein [Ruminococcus sp.]|nr:TIGR00730 family Rossman fold protein [Ruminococcus sp.]
MIICVYGAASKDIAEPFKEAGHALGCQLALRGHSLIFGGGDHGMMGSVARGVHDGGGHITGIQPSFFNVDGILYPLCDEYIYTDTMRERKQKMEDMSDAFIVSPGGIGTFEEFFEILTLKQLGRHRKPIVILNIDGYYDPMIAMMQKSVEAKFLNEKNFTLFFVTDDIGKALDYIENPDEFETSIETLRNL